MTGTTARAHTEECRKRLEECLAEDEETKFRSEAGKLRVDGWLAGRVESARNQQEVVGPSQTRRVELQAAQRQHCIKHSAAADQHQGDHPGHGSRGEGSPQVQDTKEFDPNEVMKTADVRLHEGGLEDCDQASPIQT